MSTWEIEYRGTLADTAPGGDKRSLAAWGLSGIESLTLLNLERGGLTLSVDGATSFLADLPWSYRDKIVIWRDGARYWHGWLTAAPRSAAPEADQIVMVFGDPWWWLEQTAMTDPVTANPVYGSITFTTTRFGEVSVPGITSIDWVEPGGNVTWAYRAQSAYTVQGQIRRAAYAAIRGGAPLAIGTIGIDAPAATQDSAGTTALAYLQAAVQYEPMAVGWWDYSGTTPTLHVQPRSALSATSYALSGGPAGITCRALEEMQAKAVRIRWTYTADDGETVEYTERAGNDALPIGPNVLVIDADAGDGDGAAYATYCGIAARLYAALGPLAYEGQLSLVGDVSPLAAVTPGAALNITGGRTEWASMAAVVQQVALSVVAEAESITASWGAPRHLGLSDWMELRDLGRAGATHASYGGSPSSSPDTPRPGTYGQLGGAMAADAPTGGLESSWLGGTANLIGFAEYPGYASTPPRYYRLATGSGARVSNGFSDGGCSLLVASRTDTLSGACAVDSDGKCTSSMLLHSTEPMSPDSYHGPTIGVVVDAAPGCPLGFTPPAADVATATTYTTSSDGGVCHYNPSEGNSSSQTGTASVTLTYEDTEDDASDRLMSSSTWSNWIPSAGSALWQLRTAGRTFGRRKIKIRGEWTGLTGGWWYTLQITLESRSVVGEVVGAWADDGTIEISLRASPENILDEHNNIIGRTGRAVLNETEIDATRGTERRVKSWVFLAQ